MFQFRFIVLFVVLNLFISSQVIAKVLPVEECKKYKKFKVPSSDMPNDTEKKELVGCTSKNFYYGIGIPVDYAKARKCAYIELADGGGIIFGDSTVLMMLYANGHGVKKNIEAAHYFACNLLEEGAESEHISRFERLDHFKKESAEVFDYCDNVSSSITSGYCASRDEDIADAKRNAEWSALIQKWTPEQQAKFKDFRKQVDEFIRLVVSNEVSENGPARAQFVIAMESNLKIQFKNMISDLVAGKFKSHSEKEFKEADLKLNAIYQSIQKNKDFDQDFSATTKEGVKIVQRAWVKYRDQWIKFAKYKFPLVTSDSIKTVLTLERLDMLNIIADGGQSTK